MIKYLFIILITAIAVDGMDLRARVDFDRGPYIDKPYRESPQLCAPYDSTCFYTHNEKDVGF